MIEKSSNISYEMSDLAILRVLGAFLRDTRLRQNKTQLDVAITAGIERMTLLRIEKGGGGSMATFVRVLRSLQQLHLLNQFVVQPQISPLKLAKLEQKKRQRARPKKPSPKKDGSRNKKSDW